MLVLVGALCTKERESEMHVQLPVTVPSSHEALVEKTTGTTHSLLTSQELEESEGCTRLCSSVYQVLTEKTTDIQ